MRPASSPLSAMDVGWIEAQWELYRQRPETLDVGWRVLFQLLDELDVAPTAAATDTEALLGQAIRARGHLHAATDPLTPEAAPPTPDIFTAHLSPTGRSAAVLARRYGGALTVETAHIDDPAARNWLQSGFEALGEVSPTALRETLRDLIAADGFETFLGRKFPTKKRFGAEGAEAFVPPLRRLLGQAAAAGVTHVVIGAIHRGRMNLMTTLLGRSAVRLLAEIKGAHPFPADPARTADVPYHLGTEATLTFEGKELHVRLLPNPSHLEAIDPVVLGCARALQDLLPEGQAWRIMPVILHTDAAVAAQGVVAETIQLCQPRGFSTAGTVHLVINNPWASPRKKRRRAVPPIAPAPGRRPTARFCTSVQRIPPPAATLPTWRWAIALRRRATPSST